MACAVTIDEMRGLEAAAISQGWTEAELMDLAGRRLGIAIAAYFPSPGTAIGYLGKGHNAGDALIALRVLREEYGWKVAIRESFPTDAFAPLSFQAYQDLSAESLPSAPDWRSLPQPVILLDGLVGIGASGPLHSPLSEAATEMRWLRDNTGARIVAVDLPSGTDADSGAVQDGGVTADVTFMIGAPKKGLLHSHAAHATGALSLIAVEPLIHTQIGAIELISPQSCGFAKAPRPFDFHKGLAGRVSILAGSKHYSGAAVLAARGALRGGAGLITLFTPPDAYASVASKCPPEIIIRSCNDPRELLDHRADALVVGCGLGEITEAFAKSLLQLISNFTGPTVIDADGLNYIAASGALKNLRENHLITPHPGEFQRLSPELEKLPREVAARRWADLIPATLLLKGSRTLVTRGGHPLWANSTGTPGMATGGQGDLLSGVLGALLASGLPLIQSACLGAWLCGRAAEKALLNQNESEESLAPTAVSDHLGGAFEDWKSARR